MNLFQQKVHFTFFTIKLKLDSKIIYNNFTYAAYAAAI